MKRIIIVLMVCVFCMLCMSGCSEEDELPTTSEELIQTNAITYGVFLPMYFGLFG